MRPKVSVIISVYNAERFIREALKSILNQSYQNLEVIVVDDDSRDETTKILKSFKDKRLKIIRNKKRLGLAKSLNRAFRLACGEYLSRMDADDICLLERLEKQVKFLEEKRDYALVGSWVKLIDEKGKIIGEKKYPTCWKKIKRVILRYNPFVHPSVMIRSSVLKKVGFYDVSLNGAEDYDLFLRICKRYKATNLKEFLLKYRINWQGISFASYKKTEKQAIKARIKAIFKYRYPKWLLIYLVKPLLSFLIPPRIKLFFFSRLLKRGNFY